MGDAIPQAIALGFPSADERSLLLLSEQLGALGGEKVGRADAYALGSPSIEQFLVPTVTLAILRELTRIIDAYLKAKPQREVEVKMRNGSSFTAKAASYKDLESLLRLFYEHSAASKKE